MSHFTDKYFLKLSPLPRSVFCGCGTVQPSMWQALALCWGPGMPNPHLLEKDTAGNNKGLTRLLQQTLSPALYKSSISKFMLSPFPHAGQLHSCELWLQWQKTHMLLMTSCTLSCTWNRISSSKLYCTTEELEFSGSLQQETIFSLPLKLNFPPLLCLCENAEVRLELHHLG